MTSTRDQNFLALTRFANDSTLTVDDVKVLIKNGFDVNYVIPPESCEWDSYTALHLLAGTECSALRIEIFKLLCSLGANYLKKNRRGFTPLRLAFETRKDKTMINMILNLHFQYKNATNPQCSNGISHFHIACLFNNVKIVKFFLDKGIPIDTTINTNSSIFSRCTGLHLAIFQKCEKTVQLLLNRGADSTCLNAKGKSPMHLIIEKQLKDASSTDDDCQNYNRMRENEDLLSEMFQVNEDDLNPVDCISLSYLHVYCTRKYTFKMEDWQKLLDADLDLNTPVHLDSKVWPGYTPMHFAAHCNSDTVILLLESGANPFAKDINGSTPIDLCLSRYDSNEMSLIFDAHSALRSLKFRNKSRLMEMFDAFETAEALKDFLRSINVHAATVPLNSPLWPGWTILHLAVELEKEDGFEIETCLEEGVPINVQDTNGLTALHKAFYMQKKTECIKKILNGHTTGSVNPVDKNGLSHFEIACIVNHKKAVKVFLSANVDPNMILQTNIKWGSKVISAGSTPLHIAAIINSPGLAKLLLARGANPNQLDADGCTWLYRSSKPYESHFNELLSLPIVLCFNPVAQSGLNYLHVACASGNFRAVEALLPFASNINKPIGSESIKCLKIQWLTCLDTLLHLAARSFSSQAVEVVNLLLKSGADLSTKNADGLNPLHIALLNYEINPINRKVLIHLVFEYERKKMFPDDIGLTRLHVACFLHDMSMIRESLASLESEQSVNSRIKMDSPLWPGEAPLNLLIKKEYPKEDDAVKLVLRHIIQEIEKAVSDDRPLRESAKRLKKSPSRNSKLIVNRNGLTALHISCMGNDVGIIENLLRLGVDFNVHKDYSGSDAGFYPMHSAMKYGSIEVILFLLKYKVNIDCYDSRGNTPIHLAALNYNHELDFFDRSLTTMEFCNKKPRKYQYNWNGTVSRKFNLIAKLMQKFSGPFFKLLVENITNVNNVDEKGGNIFHYLKYPLQYYEINIFLKSIETLINLGCELDHQDKEGRTALHYEAERGYKNYYDDDRVNGVTSLLLAGADVNIIDNYGKTPIEYSDVNKVFLEDHISKLDFVGLYVNDINKKYVSICNDYYEDLLIMKETFITKTINLRDVLTEEIVAKFPMMRVKQQRAILKYLNSNKVKDDYEDWLSIFNLQRKKALNAKKLYEQTVLLMRSLFDPRLPDHCINSILIRLSIEDWRNFNLAADQN